MSLAQVTPVTAEAWQEAVLGELGLRRNAPHTLALFTIAALTGLDPLTGQVGIFRDKVYIGRDGYLVLAYRSGTPYELTVDEHNSVGAEDDRGRYWRAVVTCRLFDPVREFKYGARSYESEHHRKGKPKDLLPDAWERAEWMSLARAERRSLRRAFPLIVGGVPLGDSPIDGTKTEAVSVERSEPMSTREQQARLDEERQAMTDADRTSVRTWCESNDIPLVKPSELTYDQAAALLAFIDDPPVGDADASRSFGDPAVQESGGAPVPPEGAPPDTLDYAPGEEPFT